MSMGTVGVAPGTTTFNLQDGTVIALADWIDDRVFGVVQLSNGQSGSLECFGAGLSQQIPGGTRTLTTADTNLQRPGSNGLPQAYELLVFSIGIDFVRACRPQTGGAQPVIADGSGALSEPLRNSTFFGINRITNIQFKYREKVYAEGVPVNFPNGRGAYINVTSSDFEVVNNGRPDPRSRNSMVLPVRLQENLSFKVVFAPQSPLAISQLATDGGTNLTFVDAKTELNGLYKRPVV
jgi:hypothetical protein